MPLVVISGHPCSGKTTVATALNDAMASAGLHSVLISDNTLFPDRNICYSTTPNEKNTRAKLRSEATRLVSQQTTAILDSINNIKGYRYELWCIARAAATKCCVLWVATPLEVCRQWNESRPSHEAYSSEVFEDLGNRFELPNAQTRWDSPLFTVRPDTAGNDLASDLAAVVRSFTTAESGQVTVGPTATVSKQLRPNVATTTTQLSATNLLHDLDQAAQEVINRISEAQAAAGAGLGPGSVHVGGGTHLTLDHPVSVAELRRLKRGFLKAATSGMDYHLPTKEAGARVFADYVMSNLSRGLR